jgi:hypothetical protein
METAPVDDPADGQFGALGGVCEPGLHSQRAGIGLEAVPLSRWFHLYLSSANETTPDAALSPCITGTYGPVVVEFEQEFLVGRARDWPTSVLSKLRAAIARSPIAMPKRSASFSSAHCCRLAACVPEATRAKPETARNWRRVRALLRTGCLRTEARTREFVDVCSYLTMDTSFDGSAGRGTNANEVWIGWPHVQPALASGTRIRPPAGRMLIQQPDRASVVNTVC